MPRRLIREEAGQRRRALAGMPPLKGAGMSFEEEVQRVLAFRDKRAWGRFHNPKDLAISVSLEAAELLETFQWSGAEVEVSEKRSKIEEELADVVIYCIHLADCIGADIPSLISAKMTINEERYPVEKSFGNARKYTDL